MQHALVTSEADRQAFNPTYAKIVHQYRLATEPDYGARIGTAENVCIAALHREVVASKGHPREGAAERLAEHMRRDGGSIEGFRLKSSERGPGHPLHGCGWL